MSLSKKDKQVRLSRGRKQKASREKRLKDMLELFDQYGTRKKTRRVTGKQWRKGSL